MRFIWMILILTLTLSSCNGQNENRADSLFAAANDRLKTNPDNIDSLDIKQSILDYSEAIKLKPKFWEAYSNRAGVYQSINEFAKAVADLTVALKYADRNSAVSLYDKRASSYYAIGKYHNAISDWTIAVNNLADPSYALLHRAKAEWQIRQKEKSCADFKKATDLNKSLADKNEFITCK